MFLLAEADTSPWQIARLIVLAVGVGTVIFLFFKGYEMLAGHFLSRTYAGLDRHDPPLAGDVAVTYHTYHGLVIWFTQVTHDVALPADQARILLRRMMWFNLTWGMLTWGAVFIPFLSVGNYLAQLRSIRRQESEGFVDAVLVSADADGDSSDRRV